MKIYWVYRIFRSGEWAGVQNTGRYAGGALDRAGGCRHLSVRDQVAGTLAARFPRQRGLKLLRLKTAGSDPRRLRRESSRAGEAFPQYYERLPLRAVDHVYGLPVMEGGLHRLPF